MLNGKKIVAICTSRIFEPVHHRYLRLLSDKLEKENIGILIFALNSDMFWNEEKYNPETVVFDLVPYKYADIIIIMDEKIKSITQTQKIIDRAKRRNVPVIVVDGNYKDTVDVWFDYDPGFEKIVRHIIEFHGAKKPCFIAGHKDNKFSERRIAIFKKVIEENGIEFRPDMIRYGEFWAMPARKAMNDILESGNIPDAVICANDIMAINVIDVLKIKGYKVPEDIIVSGFDGIDEANYCTPKLATARCDGELMAEAVFECIERSLKGEVFSEKAIVPVLEPSESCGCGCKKDIPTISLVNRLNNTFYRYQDDIRIMYEICTVIHMSEDAQAASECLDQPIMHDVNCFIYRSCFDYGMYYFDKPLLSSEQNKFKLFYDCHDHSNNVRDINESFFYDWLSKRLSEKSSPIIFNTLDYLSKPLGFVCYTFDGYDIIDYARTASITNTLSMGLGSFVQEQYQLFVAKRVEQMYLKDDLTGLLSRSGFNKEFSQLCSVPENIGMTITVIMSDLDGLKYINDTFGHDEGDRAISAAADMLRSSCPEGSLCVRYGGDEMLAVFPGDTDTQPIIDNIDMKLNELNKKVNKKYKVSLSCGSFKTALSPDFDLTNAIKRADEVMYRNKRTRKASMISENK